MTETQSNPVLEGIVSQLDTLAPKEKPGQLYYAKPPKGGFQDQQSALRSLRRERGRRGPLHGTYFHASQMKQNMSNEDCF